MKTAWTINWPMPGIAKIDSTMTLPPMRPGSESPRIVTTGSSAFLNACLPMTDFSESPLARAAWM